MSIEYTFYKIVCNDPEIQEIYVGSTDNFQVRKAKHRYEYKVDPSRKVYAFIIANGSWSNWRFETITLHNFNSEREAHKREQYYADLYCSTLNSYKSYQTPEQARQNMIVYQKQYRIDNKEITAAKNKNYREKNNCTLKAKKGAICVCLCGSTYTHQHQKRHFKTKKHQTWESSQELDFELPDDI